MATLGTALAPQTRLGEYLILAVLGEGGFGITYCAEDTHLDCLVAIKEFMPATLARRHADGSVASLSERHSQSFQTWKRRFLDEARTLARFRHRGIVRVLRFFESYGTAYLVMELEQGVTLEQHLAALGRTLTQAEFDALAAPLLDALEAVHVGGVLHRDIKPSNIIIRSDGSPVLIDFGAARQDLEDSSRTLTPIYTPGYAAPEQFAEHGRLGPWTDIFAMSAVFYRAICGNRPIEALSRVMHPNDLLVPTADMVPPGAFRPGTLAGIDAALALDLDRRPQSVAVWRGLLLPQPELALSLAEPVPTLGPMEAPMVSALPVTWPDGPTMPSHDPAEQWDRQAEEQAWPLPAKEARRPLRLAAAGVGAAAVVVAGLLIWGMRDAPPAPPAAPVTVAEAPPAVPEAQPTAAKTPVAPSASPTEPPPPGHFQDCPDCPDMVVLPAGRFTMGSPPDEPHRRDREGPQIEVTFAKPFAIARTPVTRGQYQAFVTATGRKGDGCSIYGKTDWTYRPRASWREPGFEQDDTHPVVCVSWTDAQAYVAWLGKRTGRAYRLPSEAEWEYAARAGSATARPWGDASQCGFVNAADRDSSALLPNLTAANCADGHVYTAPVGSFPANGFGLSDMLGNVAQWTQDCWHDDHKGAAANGMPRGGRCSRKVVRGSAWSDPPESLRVAIRYGGVATHQDASAGFRVAAEP